ncbi:MAG: signal peptidase I [bacterium]|nr:signal peptidase I [bacterium]
MLNHSLKSRLYHFWRHWVLFLLIMIVSVTSFRSAIADWNDVPTGSMKPTILEGDRIFVNRIAYDLKIPYTQKRIATWSAPERGDIVICNSPHDGTRLVKRVVGLPGDEIAMRNNVVYIDGEPLQYKPLAVETATARGGDTSGRVTYRTEVLGECNHTISIIPSKRALRNFKTVQIPEGQYFVMGDNRDESADSRYFGFMARGNILGEVKGVVASVDPEHHYLPRWNRFFTSLDN